MNQAPASTTTANAAPPASSGVRLPAGVAAGAATAARAGDCAGGFAAAGSGAGAGAAGFAGAGPSGFVGTGAPTGGFAAAAGWAVGGTALLPVKSVAVSSFTAPGVAAGGDAGTDRWRGATTRVTSSSAAAGAAVR
jgi:hypothetical protein